ncbi:MAG: AtpZ/AtpI family protein [Desulfovibrionaceae bacterium]|nr:AtpZ/AtpI family protein [Desulfovibrionaceae bacterium]
MGRAVTTASVVGLHMVVAVFIGFGIGYFLDDFFGTTPWLTAVFLVTGIAAGFKNLIVQGKRLMAYQDKIDAERHAAEVEANLRFLRAAKSSEQTPDAGKKRMSPGVTPDSEE